MLVKNQQASLWCARFVQKEMTSFLGAKTRCWLGRGGCWQWKNVPGSVKHIGFPYCSVKRIILSAIKEEIRTVNMRVNNRMKEGEVEGVWAKGGQLFVVWGDWGTIVFYVGNPFKFFFKYF